MPARASGCWRPILRTSRVPAKPRSARSETEESGGVRVSVRDTGVGFGSEAAERLFETFYSTKKGGMGIGLSVSRSIVERHHGRLWATANQGHGPTFAFSIPGESPAPIDANTKV